MGYEVPAVALRIHHWLPFLGGWGSACGQLLVFSELPDFTTHFPRFRTEVPYGALLIGRPGFNLNVNTDCLESLSTPPAFRPHPKAIEQQSLGTESKP